MKLMLIKSRNGVDIPINATLEMGGQEMTVMGLAKQEVKDGMVWEWWIVEEN